VISGYTRLLALVGDPVSHSLSPRIHGEFCETLGLDYVYLAFNLLPDGLQGFFAAARLLGIQGFNATMPFKNEAFKLCDRLGPSADCGSVNTVVFRDGVSTGHSTDGAGLVRAIEGAGVAVTGKSALILGTGGTAKSAEAALKKAGAEVETRSMRIQDMRTAKGRPYRETDILINATPLGMEGFDNFASLDFVAALPGSALVFDTIYAPRRTALLQAAQERRGLRTLGGISLLVHQAALSFKLFTGKAPDEGVVRRLIETL